MYFTPMSQRQPSLPTPGSASFFTSFLASAREEPEAGAPLGPVALAAAFLNQPLAPEPSCFTVPVPVQRFGGELSQAPPGNGHNIPGTAR